MKINYYIVDIKKLIKVFIDIMSITTIDAGNMPPRSRYEIVYLYGMQIVVENEKVQSVNETHGKPIPSNITIGHFLDPSQKNAQSLLLYDPNSDLWLLCPDISVPMILFYQLPEEQKHKIESINHYLTKDMAEIVIARYIKRHLPNATDKDKVLSLNPAWVNNFGKEFFPDDFDVWGMKKNYPFGVLQNGKVIEFPYEISFNLVKYVK